MTDRYDDIINLPYSGSRANSRMSMHNRAAQFAPFAALNGHDEAIEETARLTSDFVDLSEDQTIELSRKLAYILSLPEPPTVDITYFVPDEHKTGGRYVTVQGRIRKIEESLGLLILEDKTRIPLRHIINLTSWNIF